MEDQEKTENIKREMNSSDRKKYIGPSITVLSAIMMGATFFMQESTGHHIAHDPLAYYNPDFMQVAHLKSGPEKLLTRSIFSTHTAPRYALVIGNGAYHQVPSLDNPNRDARAMGQSLRRLGFNVQVATDTTRLSLQESIRSFVKNLPDDAVTLFYYAGHGVQLYGKSFLIPVDAEMTQESELEMELININEIISEFNRKGSDLNLLIIDACRDNPWRHMMMKNPRTIENIQQPHYKTEASHKGTLIAYATSENQVAEDGFGRHSPYTQALLNWIEKPNIEIGPLFRYVRQDVKSITEGRQTPWETGSLTEEFYFQKVSKKQEHQFTPLQTADSRLTTRPHLSKSTVTQQAKPLLTRPLRPKEQAEINQQEQMQKRMQEDNYWKAVQEIEHKEQKIAALEDYMKAYNQGHYVGLARLQLIDLKTFKDQARQSATPQINPQQSTPESQQIASPATAIAIERAERKLTKDQRIQIQEALAIIGLYRGEMSGIFGPVTRGGIMAYQQSKNLMPTGYLNQQEMILLFADSATQTQANPDKLDQVKKVNGPTWFVAAMPNGQLGYVYGIQGDPQKTKIENAEQKNIKQPVTTAEGSIALLDAAEQLKSQKDSDQALQPVFVQPELDIWSSSPPPAPGPAGTKAYQAHFNVLVHSEPAKYAREIGYYQQGTWARVAGITKDQKWLQVISQHGKVGYVEAFALSATPKLINPNVPTSN